MFKAVRVRVVKVFDFESLANHLCGFKSRHGIRILSCQEAIQLAYGTSVLLLRCPLVPGIIQGLPLPLKAIEKLPYDH